MRFGSVSTTFSGLSVVLFLWVASPAYSAVLTGMDLIYALNVDSFNYQDFAIRVNNLPNFPGSPEAQELVDQYSAFIDAQMTDGDLTGPPGPYSEVEQFAFVSAYRSLFLEDRRYLYGIVANIDAFSEQQKETLSDDVFKQYALIDETQAIFSENLPMVEEILSKVNDIARKTIADTLEALAR